MRNKKRKFNPLLGACSSTKINPKHLYRSSHILFIPFTWHFSILWKMWEENKLFSGNLLSRIFQLAFWSVMKHAIKKWGYVRLLICTALSTLQWNPQRNVWKRDCYVKNDNRLLLIHLMIASHISGIPEAEDVLSIKRRNRTKMPCHKCEVDAKTSLVFL